jgi:hypothetical protein
MYSLRYFAGAAKNTQEREKTAQAQLLFGRPLALEVRPQLKMKSPPGNGFYWAATI